MANDNPEEIDLLFLYRKVRELYRGMLLNLYRFLARFWYVVIVVILAGFALGLYMEKNKPKQKETEMLVQINFDAVDYVYDAVTQFKSKINEKDRTALAELEEDFNNLFNVKNLEITPVTDVRDLDNNIESNNRNIETFLDQSKYEEDLLLSDMFLSQYKLHKITITGEYNTHPKITETILKYLNNNDSYTEIKEVGIKNLENEIVETKQSISEIDSVMTAYGTILGNQNNPGSIYVNTSSNVNMHFLIQEKTKLVKDLQELETDLIRHQDGLVSLINKPMLRRKASFLNKTSILMPIFFFISFSIIVYLVGLFRKLRRIDKESK